MQNIPCEEWCKHSELKICSLEWNFGFQIWWKFQWTSTSRILVENSKIRDYFRCNYSFFDKNSLKKIAVWDSKYPMLYFCFDILFLAAYCFRIFVVCLFLEHYTWILFQKNLKKFLKIKFEKHHQKKYSIRSSRPEVYCRKNAFLKISQNSQENTCARDSFFNKVAGLRPAILLKKSLYHRCFPVNFAKFLRAPFFIEQLRWLLLFHENECLLG